RAEHADLRSRQERERDVRQHLPVWAVELVGPVHRVHVVAAHRPPTIATKIIRPRVDGFGSQCDGQGVRRCIALAVLACAGMLLATPSAFAWTTLATGVGHTVRT